MCSRYVVRINESLLEDKNARKHAVEVENFKFAIWFISSLYHFWDKCCLLFVSICFLVHCWLLSQSCVRSSLSGQEGIRKKTLSENLVSWFLDCSEGNIRGFTNCSNTELQCFVPPYFCFFCELQNWRIWQSIEIGNVRPKFVFLKG